MHNKYVRSSSVSNELKINLSNYVLVYPEMCTGDLLETIFFILNKLCFQTPFIMLALMSLELTGRLAEIFACIKRSKKF